MPENPRIEELRRRVQKDKASIAFAQLAEEYRRAGRFDEAIETCRTGLSHHPGYLSAHVTLGRALIETGDLPAAHDELTRVLAAAPENLAALKGLAEIHHRRGEREQALDYYRRALVFAPNDSDIEHQVAQITRELEPGAATPEVAGGLSFEEFMALGEAEAAAESAPSSSAEASAAAEPPAAEPVVVEPAVVDPSAAQPWAVEPAPVEPVTTAAPMPVTAVDAWPGADPAAAPSAVHASQGECDPAAAAVVQPEPSPSPIEPEGVVEAALAERPVAPIAVDEGRGVEDASAPAPTRSRMQVEALERWLDAILAERRLRD